MKTHWVELDVDGAPMRAYVAEPSSPPRAGVVIIQEIFGVNAPMQAAVELCASVGYFAIAPAMFHRTDPNFEAGYDPAGFAKGARAAAEIRLETARRDLEVTAAYARERVGADAKIAAWGFCFGGSMAFLAATLPAYDAAVSFYGGQIARSPAPGRPALLSLAPQVHAPIFFAFGSKDEHIPAADHDAIRAALDDLGKSYEFVVEPEGHGFFRFGPESNDGARDVWPRVRSFLATRLAASAI